MITSKKVFAVAVILFLFSVSAFSQFRTSDLSVGLGYPIPVGNNFMNRGVFNGYTGIVDVGLDYTVVKFRNLDVGLLFNASFLDLKSKDFPLNILTSKVKVGYTIEMAKVDIQPQLAIGYSRLSFYGKEYKDAFYGYEYIPTTSGPSARASTKVIFKSDRKVNFYVSLAYEFTKIRDITLGYHISEFDRKFQMLTPGVGAILKFNKL